MRYSDISTQPTVHPPWSPGRRASWVLGPMGLRGRMGLRGPMGLLGLMGLRGPMGLRVLLDLFRQQYLGAAPSKSHETPNAHVRGIVLYSIN